MNKYLSCWWLFLHHCNVICQGGAAHHYKWQPGWFMNGTSQCLRSALWLVEWQGQNVWLEGTILNTQGEILEKMNDNNCSTLAVTFLRKYVCISHHSLTFEHHRLLHLLNTHNELKNAWSYITTISCGLITCQNKGPGHQQSWYWLNYPGVFLFQYQRLKRRRKTLWNVSLLIYNNGHHFADYIFNCVSNAQYINESSSYGLALDR